MEIVDTKNALKNFKINRPSSVWSVADSPGRGYETAKEGMGGSRVFSPNISIRRNPKFKFQKKQSFLQQDPVLPGKLKNHYFDLAQMCKVGLQI